MVLKCYTRQKKNGGNYTNCINGKGEQMREKDKKKPVKKKPVKRKKLVIVDKPKGHVDITVASGGKGTTTTFKATKPRTKRAPVALTRVGGPTGKEGIMVVTPNSMEDDLGLMPQAEMDMQINNALNLVAKARAIRRIGLAKKNISEQNSALSSSAPEMTLPFIRPPPPRPTTDKEKELLKRQRRKQMLVVLARKKEERNKS